jgi:predicted HTH transcriptional regulator
MDILREIAYAEKAGSGYDKIFKALLNKGKKLPEIIACIIHKNKQNDVNIL